MRSPVASDPVVAERPVIVDGAPVGRVWLERDTAHGLDEMVIERMELTVAARWAARVAPARPTDVALVELLISERSNEEDRHRASACSVYSPIAPNRVLAARAATGMGLGQAVQDAFAGLGRSTGVARAVVVAERAAIVYQSAQSLEEVIELAEKNSRISLHLGNRPEGRSDPLAPVLGPEQHRPPLRLGLAARGGSGRIRGAGIGRRAGGGPSRHRPREPRRRSARGTRRSAQWQARCRDAA